MHYSMKTPNKKTRAERSGRGDRIESTVSKSEPEGQLVYPMAIWLLAAGEDIVDASPQHGGGIKACRRERIKQLTF